MVSDKMTKTDLEQQLTRKPYGIDPPLTELDVLVYENAVNEFKSGPTYCTLAGDWIKDCLAVDYGFHNIKRFRNLRDYEKDAYIARLRGADNGYKTA